MDEIKQLLGHGEKVLWRGKPVRKPFFMSRMVSSIIVLPAGIIMSIIVGIMSIAVLATFPVMIIFLLPFILIALSLLFSPLTTYWWFSKQYPHLEYVITNKRVMLKAGWIGRDFK